jgi:hypothetical protein
MGCMDDGTQIVFQNNLSLRASRVDYITSSILPPTAKPNGTIGKCISSGAQYVILHGKIGSRQKSKHAQENGFGSA